MIIYMYKYTVCLANVYKEIFNKKMDRWNGDGDYAGTSTCM